MARPPREIDLDQLTALASVGLTQSECAAILKCSPDTIQRRPECVDAYNDGIETCKASLRRRQFEIAMKGNVTALIWLGKNLLGQSDKLEATGKDGAPLFPTFDREELIGKLSGPGPKPEPVPTRDAPPGSLVQ
jgi:hypothetical protein